MRTVLLFSLLAKVAFADRPKLIVLDLQAGAGVTQQEAVALTEAVTGEAARNGVFQVLSSREVMTLIGLERQKQLMGCGEDQTNCFVELAGGLDARFVLSGSVSRIGSSYQLALRMLDAQKAETASRSTRLARELDALRAILPYAVAEATGTPPPPPPSRLLPYSLMGAGAAALVGGGVVGLQAFADEEALSRELRRGESAPLVATIDEYRAEAEAIRARKAVAAVVAGLGAASLVAGLLLNPGEGEGASVALAPSPGGLGLVGVLP